MILLKGCPRCRGDLKTDKDFYGEYRECLQCGYMEDIDRANRNQEPTPERDKRRAA